MEARLLFGSDDAQSDSGHGSDEGWDWWHWSRLRQRNMAQGLAALGASGHAGREEWRVSFWLNPPSGLNRPF